MIFSDKQVGAKGVEAVGSVKTAVITDVQGKQSLQVMRKIGPNEWIEKDAENPHLTVGEREATLSDMAKEQSLIPRADAYLDAEFNVLLRALHGVGKTESLLQLAQARGLKLKYFSCATLDPYTDLVGVPTPVIRCMDCGVEYESMKEAHELHPEHTNLKRTLRMVRPLDVDEADIIFFDEFNRGDSKTQNAVFEIIQFGTINGEVLPNLRCCWAAINPDDSEMGYNVEQIDVALIDRFDIFIDMVPRVSVTYMSKYMPKPIAEALYKWWTDHQDALNSGVKDKTADYISPRRMMKIGLVWLKTKEKRSLEAAFPPSGHFERGKLYDLLKEAQKRVDGVDVSVPDDKDLGGNNIGDRPSTDFIWKKKNMQMKQDEMAEWLHRNQMAKATHDEVLAELSRGVGGDLLIIRYQKILNALLPSHVESMLDEFPVAKVDTMKKEFIELQKNDPNLTSQLTRLHSLLDKAGSQDIDGWVKP